MQLKNIVSIRTGVSHSLALDSTGRVFAWGDSRYGAIGKESLNQPKVILQGIIQIACGADHSFFLT
jgi:alpha-tubulin suppressor-like RCC1 family protein